MNLVWAEIDEFTGHAVRIFRNRKSAFEAIAAPKLISKALAVSQIRRQIFDRQEGVCVNCPEMLTWGSGHLHEKIHRGQGGEISLENSEMLCYSCHLGKRGAHGDRRPQFGGK